MKNKVIIVVVLMPGIYCVAVSGGVDSVVLLDMLHHKATAGKYTLIVAHFDHGIREDSANDARFVGELAASYNLQFETKREELGKATNEETARKRRYAFLHMVAKKHNAKIVTAHHSDDVIETIAINLKRGTGWRGLAALDNPDILRPLLHMRKSEITDYAKERQLEWREDSTNASDRYLRNRLRRMLVSLDPDIHLQLLALRDQQVYIKQQIDSETKLLVRKPYSRYFFVMTSESVALELLRFICVEEGGASVQRPQLLRALLMIKTATPGTLHDVGDGVKIEFSRTEFIVKTSGR